MRSLLVLYDLEVNVNSRFIHYDTILVFDLKLKLDLIKLGHSNVCLVSELDCDHTASQVAFETVNSDVSANLKVSAKNWDSVIEGIALNDLFEFQLRNALGPQINLYVTLKKYLSERRFDIVVTNIVSDSPYSLMLRKICNDLELQLSICSNVKLSNMDASHLDFSTTKGVGSSHRSGSYRTLLGAVFNGTFLHTVQRLLQRVYIRNVFLRMLFFFLLCLSNVVKDILEFRTRNAVVVCYDKWISILLNKVSSDTLIVFHMITPPITLHFIKYYFSPGYRFSYSFASIFSRKAFIEKSSSLKRFHSVEAVNIIEKKISEEGRFLIECYLAIEWVTNRYNVRALLTSYDSPMLHRATVVAAKARGVPTVLNLHGITSPPEFNGEALYCDYIVSWSNLIQVYHERDKSSVIEYENPYHSCDIKLRKLENQKSYSVLVATTNSPTDYCTCLMNVAETRFLEFVKKINNNNTLRNWNFTFKIHPSENIKIYQEILSDFDNCSVELVNGLLNDQYSEFDFGICLSPTTFMFDLVNKGLPIFFYDFKVHGVSYYKNYLFNEFKINESIITDLEIFLLSKLFLSDQIQLEQEKIRELIKGSGSILLIDDIVEKKMKDKLCKE